MSVVLLRVVAAVLTGVGVALFAVKMHRIPNMLRRLSGLPLRPDPELD
jgi:hypothetical protein